MARGIFVKQNGTWSAVTKPAVNNNGTWSEVKAGYINQNGVWTQFYPNNVLAKLLVVGGGGGGGIGYGNEGGGGGGAGGVVYKENIVLSLAAGTTYPIVVGSGGGVAGLGLTTNSLGTRGYSYQDFSRETGHELSVVQAVGRAYTNNSSPLGQFFPTYDSKGRAGTWGSFINSYGVWTDPDGYSPFNSVTVTTYFFVNFPYSGRYMVRLAADNWMSFSVNGQHVASMEGFQGSNDYDFTATAGPALITINARNYDRPSSGNPAGFAAAIFNTSANIIWSTQPGTKPFWGLNRKPEFAGLKYWCDQYVNAFGRNPTRLYEAMFNTVISQGATSTDFKNGAFGPASGIAFNNGQYSGDLSDKPDISLGYYYGGGVSGNGNDSSALGFTAIGGGSGGWGINQPTAGAGGSGGGGCGNTQAFPGGAGTPGQGYPGGIGYPASGGAGGGGFGSTGFPSAGDLGVGGGAGGLGVQFLGFSVGGGGGGGTAAWGWGGIGGGGAGGSGGGGAGGGNNNLTGRSGTPGTGGGGGGSAYGGKFLGGSGGSGIVVVRYPGSKALFTGGSVTVNNGEVTHVFESTGVLASI